MEATIAILIVSAVLIVIYSRQSVPADSNEQIYNLQKKVLNEISSRSDLRLKVLEGGEDVSEVQNFASSMIPDFYGSYLVVCDLGETCRPPSQTEIENFRDDVDVYVEEVVISAEIDSDTGQGIYNPKKVRFFVWELSRV